MVEQIDLRPPSSFEPCKATNDGAANASRRHNHDDLLQTGASLRGCVDAPITYFPPQNITS